MSREQYLQQAPNLALGRKLTVVTCVLTLAVWLLVVEEILCLNR